MTNETNDPYRPPTARLADREPIPGELATRRARFSAAFVDTFLLMLVFGPLQWWFGVFDGFPEIRQPGVLENLAWTAVGLVVYLAFNGWLLADRGQTIGKLLVGVQIVRTDLSRCSLQRILAARLLPFWLIGLIPILGPVLGAADPLAIFGSSRRCLHDRLADTIVVTRPKPGGKLGIWG